MTTISTAVPSTANESLRPDGRGEAIQSAWAAISGMEENVTLVRALLRSMNLMVTAADVIDDERNSEAVLHTIWAAEDALKRAEETRQKAFSALHSVIHGGHATCTAGEASHA